MSGTISYRDYQKDMYKAQMKAYLRSMAMDKDRYKRHLEAAGVRIKNDEELEGLRQSALNFDKHFTLELKGGESGLLKTALEMSLEIAPCFFMKHLHILQATGTNVFTISDNPLTLLAQDRIYGKGLLSSTIIIPLTPTMALVYDNTKRPNSIIKASDTKVMKINECSMFYARKYVFSNLNSKRIKTLYEQAESQKMKTKSFDTPDSSLLVYSQDVPRYLASDILN